MTEPELKSEARKLADAFDGSLRSSKRFFLAQPFCPYEIQGESAGVRVKLWLGPDGGLAMFDRYRTPQPFQLAFFLPDRTLGLTSDITSAVDAPVRMFSNAGELYVGAINALFPTWESWDECIALLRRSGAPVTVTSGQSQWGFAAACVPHLETWIKAFARRLSTAPFEVAGGGAPARYADKPHVKLDPSRVPIPLRPLLPLAAAWSIEDEAEVRKFSGSISPRRRKEFLSAFRANLSQIESFSTTVPVNGPVTDEVVVFQLAAHAFAILASQESDD